MKRIALFVLAAGLIAYGCSNKDSTIAPTPLPDRFIFSAILLPSNEVPVVTNSESVGRGTVAITMLVKRDDAGNITSATADFDTTLSSFPSTTNVTMAHIHEGAAGIAGPIKVQTGITSGDVPLTNGAGAFKRTGANVAAADATSISNNPAGWYFNVHSTANGPGVMRGQLVKIQ